MRMIMNSFLDCAKGCACGSGGEMRFVRKRSGLKRSGRTVLTLRPMARNVIDNMVGSSLSP